MEQGGEVGRKADKEEVNEVDIKEEEVEKAEDRTEEELEKLGNQHL